MPEQESQEARSGYKEALMDKERIKERTRQKIAKKRVTAARARREAYIARGYKDEPEDTKDAEG